ncbi:invasion protein CiaB [Campylobacter sp. RM16192]|uniref:invasion protein CiaB n=1 Tax=Campylobacter sp. RM16192 TaxID=1660080 RepID=UPI001452438C|nr:invasion protein CiaB [Campylobacter sp. RM16192]QCD51941.1 invasion antigen B [Campylobacter sp. RM16192]
MNDFARISQIIKDSKDELNGLYKRLDKNEILDEALKIANFKGTKSEKIALLRRIVDLKEEPLENELKKLERSKDEIRKIKDLMFIYVKEFYEKRHQKLIDRIRAERILDDFYMVLLDGVHELGLVINDWQIAWDKLILQTTNSEFKDKFSDMSEALKFIDDNRLFHTELNGQKADRSYGAVIKTDGKYDFKPYALAFDNEVNALKEKFEIMIDRLENLAINSEQKAYVNYFKKLKNAFCERENERVIAAWQEAEIAWMDVRSPLQVGHPLEYYEDSYTHTVALEWDIRLAQSSSFDENKFKDEILESYDQICKDIGVKDEVLNTQVNVNVKRTQVYISNPMIYYGAELNGLFSAQVVPNDELVSKKCGKKIFAFVDHVYESAKSRPFMRLSSEIFDKEFLNFGREILFTKPEVWKKVYEISTIGHEFGHILFINEDSEKIMNEDGLFKFIEEYKATTGGLVNFFLHEDEEYKMPVFHELIARSVGLIAWREVDEVRAYYCEGLIHLSLLFQAGVLSFKNDSISVNFTPQSYEKFREICMQNYKNLALHYAKKAKAGEFLAKFCKYDGISYLPIDEKTKEFVEFYYNKYKQIGNEVDESGEWERWSSKI